VATHNSNFLSGILSGGQEADIYRLNRTDDITSFTKITAEATKALSTSPILSSQRVLEGIFSRGVVVCESDSDRIVYNTVAVREHSNQEILFIHAHNKQTIKDVVNLLQNASIPTVAIADIDILNSESDLSQAILAFDASLDLSDLLALRKKLAISIDKTSEDTILEEIKIKLDELLGQLTRSEHNLSGAKGAINRIYSESNKWSEIKKIGINALEGDIKTATENIIATSLKHGLYIVPVGELEGWITLGVRKNRWVLPALKEIHSGNCPAPLKDFIGQVILGVSSQLTKPSTEQ
jgi:hypothetical protein